MGLSKAIGSYEDCRQLFDKALLVKKGLKVTFKDSGAAVHMRHRMNAFRRAMRAENRTIYPEGEPGYNKSPYDHLVLKVKDNFLIIQPSSIESLEIEEIK